MRTDLVQRDALLQDFCPVGDHTLDATQVSDPLNPNFLGIANTRTMVFCRKCPFHYFPDPPQDAGDPLQTPENTQDAIQDD